MKFVKTHVRHALDAPLGPSHAVVVLVGVLAWSWAIETKHVFVSQMFVVAFSVGALVVRALDWWSR